jgi:hypothetical protein
VARAQAGKNSGGNPRGKASEMVDMIYIHHNQLKTTNKTKEG